MKFWEAMKCFEEGEKITTVNDLIPSFIDKNGKIFLSNQHFETEWKIYKKENKKIYSFMQMLQKFKENEDLKFQRLNWQETFVAMNKGVLTQFFKGIGDISSGFYLNDFEANDWVEMKEDC